MRREVLGGKWVAAELSLRACFTIAALYTYADEYNRFCREEGTQDVDEIEVRCLTKLTGDHGSSLAAWTSPDPQETVVVRDLIIRSLLTKANPRIKRTPSRAPHVNTDTEIANELGVSVETARMAIRRIQSRFDVLPEVLAHGHV